MNLGAWRCFPLPIVQFNDCHASNPEALCEGSPESLREPQVAGACHLQPCAVWTARMTMAFRVAIRRTEEQNSSFRFAFAVSVRPKEPGNRVSHAVPGASDF